MDERRFSSWVGHTKDKLVLGAAAVLGAVIGLSVGCGFVHLLVGLCGLLFFVLLFRRPWSYVIVLSATLILVTGVRAGAELPGPRLYTNIIEGIPISWLESLLVLWAITVLIRKTSQHNVTFGRGVAATPMLLWGGISALSTIVGIWRGYPTRTVLSEVRPIYDMVFAYFLCTETKMSKEALWIWVSTLGVASLIKTTEGLVEYLLGIGYTYEGVLRVFIDVEIYFFLLSFILTGYLLVRDRPRKRRGLLALFAAGALVGLIVSFSRSGWLGLATSFVAFAVINRERRYVRLVLIVVAAALLLLGFTPFRFVEITRHRLWSVLDPNEPTNLYRIYEMKNVLATIRENWILGCGFGGTWDIRYLPPGPTGSAMENAIRALCHNQYLWLWLKTGVFGIMTFFLMIWKTYACGLSLIKSKRVSTFSRSVAVSILSANTGLLAIFLAGSWLLHMRLAVFWGIQIGILEHLTRIEEI